MRSLILLIGLCKIVSAQTEDQPFVVLSGPCAVVDLGGQTCVGRPSDGTDTRDSGLRLVPSTYSTSEWDSTWTDDYAMNNFLAPCTIRTTRDFRLGGCPIWFGNRYFGNSGDLVIDGTSHTECPEGTQVSASSSISWHVTDRSPTVQSTSWVICEAHQYDIRCASPADIAGCCYDGTVCENVMDASCLCEDGSPQLTPQCCAANGDGGATNGAPITPGFNAIDTLGGVALDELTIYCNNCEPSHDVDGDLRGYNCASGASAMNCGHFHAIDGPWTIGRNGEYVDPLAHRIIEGYQPFESCTWTISCQYEDMNPTLTFQTLDIGAESMALYDHDIINVYDGEDTCSAPLITRVDPSTSEFRRQYDPEYTNCGNNCLPGPFVSRSTSMTVQFLSDENMGRGREGFVAVLACDHIAPGQGRQNHETMVF